jgi:hypothetical protein
MILNQRHSVFLRSTLVLSIAALLSFSLSVRSSISTAERLYGPDSLVGEPPILLNLPYDVAGPLNLFSAGPFKDKSTSIVNVDCNKGDSVNQALAKDPGIRNLTIEISGMCHENVVVTRDHVTLHGTDPASDGIQADLNSEITDVALWVRGAQLVTAENLKFTGGFSGLLATDVGLTNLHLINCRLDGNNAYGAQLQSALLQAEDTTFSTNGNINAGIFGGSRLQCTACTFADPQGSGPLGINRVNALAFAASRLLLTNCTLTNGGITSDDSLVLVIDSTISGLAPGGNTVFAFGSSSVQLTRVQVNGGMNFNQGAIVQLLGVTQTTPLTNTMDDRAYVKIGDASPATGGPPSIPSTVKGFLIRNFSKVALLQTSHVTGNFNCSQGADAFCTTPANISGTSNCGQCPKP